MRDGTRDHDAHDKGAVPKQSLSAQKIQGASSGEEMLLFLRFDT